MFLEKRLIIEHTYTATRHKLDTLYLFETRKVITTAIHIFKYSIHNREMITNVTKGTIYNLEQLKMRN